MRSINLLSPNEKKHVRDIVRRYWYVRTASTVFSLLAIITTVLFFQRLILQNQQSSLDQQIETYISVRQEGSVGSPEEIIKALNQTLTKTETVQQRYIPWTEVLATFARQVPEGITLNIINFNTSADTFTVEGVASDREALLAFQALLEALPYCTGGTIPPSALTLREDIAFSISGTLTPQLYD